ncbi:MAG: hypothetical protein M3R00_07645, partial [Pseudomonadota bacterium]|nr:hypothetical protein [Pseudomonadota bacterium]
VYIVLCSFMMLILLSGELGWRYSLLHRAQNLARAQLSAESEISKRRQAVTMVMQQRQQNIEAIAVSNKNQQRLRVGARLLRHMSEALPNGAVMRLLEINDQTVRMKIMIQEKSLSPALLAAMLRLPELNLLQIHQVQRMKDAPYYELVFIGKLAMSHVSD